jgi:hypothetical protein
MRRKLSVATSGGRDVASNSSLVLADAARLGPISERIAVVTASARNRPDLMNSIDSGRGAK